jgi:methylmalonyl-CoA mutase C-terminal domain/subunit
MKEKGITDMKLVVGGVIPPEDVVELQRSGVVAVFTPGTRKNTIINKILDLREGGRVSV